MPTTTIVFSSAEISAWPLPNAHKAALADQARLHTKIVLAGAGIRATAVRKTVQASPPLLTIEVDDPVGGDPTTALKALVAIDPTDVRYTKWSLDPAVTQETAFTSAYAKRWAKEQYDEAEYAAMLPALTTPLLGKSWAEIETYIAGATTGQLKVLIAALLAANFTSQKVQK